MYTEDELLALSGLQHLAYCERQWALIHLEKIWKDSIDTVRGNYFHERVDMAGYSCVDGVRAERGVHLVSYSLGLYGVADIVEYGVGGADSYIRPIEYKVGKPKVEDWDRIQATAQVLCLEEMHGKTITTASLFYGETRRREYIEVNEKLRSEVKELAEHMHNLFEAEKTPQAKIGPKCCRCSLADECLPKISNFAIEEYWMQFDRRQ
ncbi:CRISPR-associated protein Cas4 [Atopobium sp. oral taxon 199]|uniref:CRISPR-associated protein Cas4 n=1 Tax=Atopobium sp. oral taxon 199 TaxID=712156 RepID=UPI00034E614A|nr:CRISPR-associated protein Cas4 [Atopobium sp. oral taxon 199]EPD77057.1 CRISPR-associated protein cas4 [Atopobium sp. oral taxon 199 str. F0494]